MDGGSDGICEMTIPANARSLAKLAVQCCQAVSGVYWRGFLFVVMYTNGRSLAVEERFPHEHVLSFHP